MFNFRKLLVGKKAQLTVFIILGIVVLLAAGIWIFVIRQPSELSPEVQVAEEVPEAFKPVKDFVESCLNQKLRESFIIMGQHGGYLDMADAEISKKVFKLDTADPTSSDAAFMTSSVSSGVAYWWYMKSDNKCLDCLMTDENQPSVATVEKQSDYYINENILGCLDDFRSFKQQGFDIAAGLPSSETKVTQNEVVVMLNYPLNATLGDNRAEMTSFYTKIPLDFRKFYELAQNIKLAEVNTSFLEYVPKQIIGIYGTGATSNRLPPIYFREESYVPKVWSMRLVGLELRSLLSSFVPLISLKGTKNAKQVTSSDPMTNGLYKAFYHETLLGSGYENFSIYFHYLGWPTYLYIGPGDGEILGATSVRDIPLSFGPYTIMPTVPIREYAFFYDLSYPVIVELRKEEDFFGEGYSFFFAMESNIRDNRDIQEWLVRNGTYGNNIQDLFSLVNLAEVEIPESADDASRNLSEIASASQKDSKSLFCSPKQRVSGNFTFVVKDKMTGKELDGVKIKYGCGVYEFCSLGITGFELELNKTRIVSKLPICRGGGVLRLEKEGYQEEVIMGFDVSVNDSREFEISLSPFIEKEVRISKVLVNRSVIYFDPYDNYGNNYTKSFSLLSGVFEPSPENDSIMITLMKKDVSPIINPPTTMISFDPSLNSSKIKLSPGIYEVRTTFININGLTIEPSLRCKDHDAYDDYVDNNDKNGCFFMPEEPVIMDQSIAGGLELNNDTGYWMVTEDKLLEDNYIELKVLQMPEMVILGDLDEMGLAENLTQKFRPRLEPVFHPN